MHIPLSTFSLFFFNDTATTEIYTLSLHDALPISFELSISISASCRCATPYTIARPSPVPRSPFVVKKGSRQRRFVRSEEHTSELQSHLNLVCRLLLEKKKINKELLRCTKATPKRD